MRLLNTKSLSFTEFYEPEVPPYAILSHRWQEDEITYRDVRDSMNLDKAGWNKVKRFCTLISEGYKNSHNYREILQQEYDYWANSPESTLPQKVETGCSYYEWVWIDTCCIDRSSSAELSEAINSMYTWYKHASICFVYLFDLAITHFPDQKWFGVFSMSSWFTQGWTIQELLAPYTIYFIPNDWQTLLGTKVTLVSPISEVTGIGADILFHGYDLQSCSIATKMSWASRRHCTRPEDLAYCLMGLFDVNMPLLYGEGSGKAFVRLQLEILKISTDESVFAWNMRPPPPDRYILGRSETTLGLLASAPSCFHDLGDVAQRLYDRDRPPIIMTSKGLLVEPFVYPSGATVPQARGFEKLSCFSHVNARDILKMPLNCSIRGIQVIILLQPKPRSAFVDVYCRYDPMTSFTDIWTQYRCARDTLQKIRALRKRQRLYIPQHEYQYRLPTPKQILGRSISAAVELMELSTLDGLEIQSQATSYNEILRRGTSAVSKHQVQ